VFAHHAGRLWEEQIKQASWLSVEKVCGGPEGFWDQPIISSSMPGALPANKRLLVASSRRKAACSEGLRVA
jgi:hypothetical protein